ncbi:MAG: sulfite exporter TauE/SafE family protein [Candidatus Omnitrophota bacterium]|nr:sulfite exporter TauE/SafE family protein [Candidatus Omnitrophota bacterium]
MSNDAIILIGAALSIGFFHTVFGPDHYLPFVAMSKARKWNMAKTGVVTLLCGLGHVLSSVVLGFIGIALGVAVFKLESIESFRGDIAAWFMLIFGFTYFVWGLRMAIRNKPHNHSHEHARHGLHEHPHKHSDEHLHIHAANEKANITPWVLFTIFVFGPCEPLIPILMYPAAKGNITSVAIVAAVFGIATISTMLALVFIFSYGLSKIPLARLERYSHALAGLIIFFCGGAIKFLGL